MLKQHDSRVVFRVDSSYEMGSGHLMRCLTLAEELRRRGCKIAFICRSLPGNLAFLAEDAGFICHYLTCPDKKPDRNLHGKEGYEKWLEVDRETDARETAAILEGIGNIDYLAVDHYSLDRYWEQEMRAYAARIMVIDDLANRCHVCDLLLDQSCFVDMYDRYRGLLPDNCQLLLGYDYLLLRAEFIEQRSRLRQRSGKINRIMIFFGGSDKGNLSSIVLQALQLIDPADIAVDVVVGKSNLFQEEIEEICVAYPWINYHCQINNIARLMADADLGIGAGGFSAYEMACLGLPAIIVAIEPSQLKPMRYLAQQGAIELLPQETSMEQYSRAICRYLGNPMAVQAMSKAGMGLFDLQGVERVADAMIKGV